MSAVVSLSELKPQLCILGRFNGTEDVRQQLEEFVAQWLRAALPVLGRSATGALPDGSHDRTGLRRQSPQSRNIRWHGRRLSAISASGSTNRGPRDEIESAEAGVSGPLSRFSGSSPKRRTGWLRRQDRTCNSLFRLRREIQNGEADAPCPTGDPRPDLPSWYKGSREKSILQNLFPGHSTNFAISPKRKPL